nr:MAG TPA: hypothetical protein [Caudoviricetes sp.]
MFSLLKILNREKGIKKEEGGVNKRDWDFFYIIILLFIYYPFIYMGWFFILLFGFFMFGVGCIL